MDARRGKKKGTASLLAAPRRMAVVGKENVCPGHVREVINGSRSPLPEGFRRAPLQDITHILSPSNVLSDEGASAGFGPRKPMRKRPKCSDAIEAQPEASPCELQSRSSAVERSVITSYGPLDASVSVMYAEVTSTKHEEADERLTTKKEIALEAEDRHGKAVEGPARSRSHAPDASRAGHGGEETVQDGNLRNRTEMEKSGKALLPSPTVPAKDAMVKTKSDKGGTSRSARSPSCSAIGKPKMSHLMRLR